LSGVARPELLKFVPPRGRADGEAGPTGASFFGPKVD